LVVVHVVVAVALILIVLLQAGKGAGIGAAFGGASQTVFGPRGPGSFLSKLTTAAAGVFMLTSLALAIFSSQRFSGSVVLTAPPRPAMAPAGPPPPAAEQATPAAPSPSEGAGGQETPAPARDGAETAPSPQ
jgi:preprotein translocase subunit SecG